MAIARMWQHGEMPAPRPETEPQTAPKPALAPREPGSGEPTVALRGLR